MPAICISHGRQRGEVGVALQLLHVHDLQAIVRTDVDTAVAKMHLVPSKIVLMEHFRQRACVRAVASAYPSSTCAMPMRRSIGVAGGRS